MKTIDVDKLLEEMEAQAEKYGNLAMSASQDSKNVHLVTYYGSIQIAINAIQISIMKSVGVSE